MGKLDEEEEENTVMPLPGEKNVLGYITFLSPMCTVKSHYF